jgi:hypothetical protein
MSTNYETKQYDGEHPAMYMHIAPFAMNPKVVREFDGYPILTDKSYVWFVVFDNNEVVAFASLKVFKNKVKFVHCYVIDSHRRNGLHIKLIIERQLWCKNNDVKLIEVDCLATSLDQYLRLNYKEVKTFKKWHKLEKQL